MKLEAVTDRKTKKDFADIFFLLESFSLAELIEMFRIKYSFIDYKFAILSPLSVDDADESEMPRMFYSFEWEAAKKFIVDRVSHYIGTLRSTIEAKQVERLKKPKRVFERKKEFNNARKKNHSLSRHQRRTDR